MSKPAFPPLSIPLAVEPDVTGYKTREFAFIAITGRVAAWLKATTLSFWVSKPSANSWVKFLGVIVAS
ncbi:MAG: hypothetical protein ACXV7C_12885, partial [Candidatus Angelobacter sp.]